MPTKFSIPIALTLALLLGLFFYGVAQANPVPTNNANVYQTDITPTPTTDGGHNAHHPQNASTLQGTVWVANEAGNSLSVIDAATNEMLTTFTGIEGPHNIQVSPDGNTIWAISGHQSIALAIDARTYTLMGVVPTGHEPAHIILSVDGTQAYVTNSADNTVTVIDVATFSVITTIPVGEFPHGLRPSPDGRWIYVANLNSETVSVLDTATQTQVEEIAVGDKPVQVAFSPDGEYVYVSLNGEDSVGKIEVATHTLIANIAVGVGPVQVFVSPDNTALLVANQGTSENPSTTVSIIDPATFEVVQTIETGDGAHGVVIDPSGKYAYITNLYSDNVSVLDFATQEIVATISVGGSPNGITFSEVSPTDLPPSEIVLELEDHHDAEDTHETENTDGTHEDTHEAEPTEVASIEADNDAALAGYVVFQVSGCTACHGVQAEGSALAPALAGHTAEQVEWQVRAPVGIMPPFTTQQMSNDDLVNLVAYITSLDGSSGHNHTVSANPQPAPAGARDWVLPHHWMALNALRTGNYAEVNHQLDHIIALTFGAHQLTMTMVQEQIKAGDYSAAEATLAGMLEGVDVSEFATNPLYLQMANSALTVESSTSAIHYLKHTKSPGNLANWSAIDQVLALINGNHLADAQALLVDLLPESAGHASAPHSH